MELREINTFIAVTQHMSFSKAAEQLGYSQAAVTLQIQNLEKELGIRLFDRLGKTIRLTANGQIFYRYAIEIRQDVQEAVENTRGTQELAGTLNIGTIDSICSMIMPELIAGYMEKYPKVKVSITTDTPARLFDMLKNNEIDLIYLVDARISDPAYVTVYEKMERSVFAAPAGHPLLDGEMHLMEEILKYPIMLTEKDASYRKVLDTALAEHGIEIVPSFQTNNTDLLLHMMEIRQAVTFLPEYVLEKLIREERAGIIRVKGLETVFVLRQVLHHKNKWVTAEMKAFYKELES